MRGDGIGQATCVINARDGRQDLRRNFFVELDVLVKLLHHRTAQRLDLAGLVGRIAGVNGVYFGGEELFALGDFHDLGALHPFDQHLDGAIGELEHLQNGRYAANAEHVAHGWIVFGSRLLRHQHDLAVAFHGGFQGFNALGSANEQRNNHVRKHDHVPQREHGQFRGGSNGGLLVGHENPFETSTKMVRKSDFSTLGPSKTRGRDGCRPATAPSGPVGPKYGVANTTKTIAGNACYLYTIRLF